jgi:outer membrane protein assembly factor BamD (BamD/ComL family)
MRNKFLPLAFLWLALLFVTSASAQDGGKRIALVIGNDSYQKIRPLQKARNDASAMARELKGAGFEVLMHHDLDYRAMVKAVETVANRITGGDQVVVFFAGHGVQIRSGSYLLPVDIEASSELEVEKTAYSLDDLMARLHEARAGFTLVMVDACRDNPIRSNGRSIGGARGLAPVEPPKGQMVVYSASRGQQALDSMGAADANPNGVFTREFVARMRQPGVRIEDLVRDVQESVETLARTISHEQRPAIYNEARGNFYFFGPTTVQVQPQATTRSRTLEEIEDGYWDSIKNERAAFAFEEYLRQYPKGRYAGQARTRIAMGKTDPKPAPATVTRSDPESALWSAIEQSGSADEYEVYLKQYPKGKYAPLARQRQQKLKDESRRLADSAEQSAWDNARQAQTSAAYGAYLATYPGGRFAALAQTRVTQLNADAASRAEEQAWLAADKARTVQAYEDYQRNYPTGRYLTLVPARLVSVREEAALRDEDLAWQAAQKAATRSAMQTYLKRYPEGRYAGPARSKDEEYGRVPPRPQLPFTIDEASWRLLEASEMYRNQPPPRTIRTESATLDQSEFTGAKSRTLPTPAPSTTTVSRTATPLGPKCHIDTTTTKTAAYSSEMSIYYCGDIHVGMTMGGKYTGAVSVKAITGSLYPPRVGAEIHLEYTGVYDADRKFDSASSITCKLTGQRPAKELDPRLTGTAWDLRCSSKVVFTGGHVAAPMLNESSDYLLEDLGIKASAIFPMNIKQKTYPSPKIGVREEYLSVEGDYGSRQWKTFTAFDWTVGQPAP